MRIRPQGPRLCRKQVSPLCLLLVLLTGCGSAATSTNPPSGAEASTGGQSPTKGSEGPLTTAANDPTVVLGDQETLVPNGTFGLGYFPDEGSAVVSTDPFRLVITDGMSKSSFLLEAAPGTADPLRHLSRATQILSPGKAGSFDNGYAGLSAVYRHTDGVFYGFYHAEDQESMGTLAGTSIPGFYARIGLATSKDGATWTKAGYVIESLLPKRVPGGNVQWDQGAAEPGAIPSADGQYLYLYFTEHARLTAQGQSRSVVISMARAELAAWPPAIPATPGPIPGFQKYNGGSFSTPGLGGADTAVVSPPNTSSNSLEGHVAYSASLKKYVMVYGVDAWAERTQTQTAQVSGLYLAFSDDGITWRSGPTPLIRDFGVVYPGLSVSWEASILWDAASDTQGWLVYSYTQNSSQTPPYLVGRRIELQGSGG